MKDGYVVTYDVKEDSRIVQANVSSHVFKEIDLKELYDMTKCNLVEKFSINNEIDLWFDEEGMFTSKPALQIIIDNEPIVLVGAICVLSHTYDPTQKSSVIVPLNEKQLSWVTTHISFGQYAQLRS